MKNAFTFSILLFTTIAWGQTPDMSYMDSLMVRYDSLESHVSSGILIDRNPQAIIAGPSNFSPLKFNGHPNSDHANNAKYKDLYELFYYATYDVGPLFDFHPDDFNNEFEQAVYGTLLSDVPFEQTGTLQKQADFVMGSMLLDFEEITSMAWDSAYIAYDSIVDMFYLNTTLNINDTVYLDTVDFSEYRVMDTTLYRDVQEVVDSSFEDRFLFVLAALNDVAYLTSPQVKFSFPEKFMVSNLGDLSDYKIDFNDGQGFRPLPTGPVTITYPDFGTYEVRLIRHDSCMLSECMAAKTKITLAELQLGTPNDTWHLPVEISPECTVTMEEGIGEGWAHIFYSDTAQGHLVKPLILVEGFESSHPESKENDICNGDGCGGNNWKSFTTGVFEHGDLPQLAKAPVMIDSLLTDGYDVIYFDMRSNRAKIEKNGNLLINLIQGVNQELQQYGSKEEIIVVAASMGSLVGRYALRKMEMQNCCHNVRTYLSFDGPHKGANIPLGIQEFLYALGTDLNPLGKGDDAKQMYDWILNSDAARQMLVYHRDPSASADRQAFADMLDNMGQPQNCRRVAVINGSDRALGQYRDPYNGNNQFLQPNEPLIELMLGVTLPVSVPGVLQTITAIGDIKDLVGGQHSWGNFPLLVAKGYTIGNSGGGYSGQMELERGKKFNSNLTHAGLHTGLWLTGTLFYAYNTYAHIATIALFAPAGCILCPVILTSLIVTNATISVAFAAALSASVLAAQSKNPHPDYNVYSDHITLPYDHAPGSFTETPQQIEDLSKGLAKAYFPHHAFMTSTTALDIDTNDLFIHVRSLDPIRNNLTSFESYYAPIDTFNNEPFSPNEMHVEITDANIAWTLEELRTSMYGLNDPGTPKYKQLTGYYNFARPNDPQLAYQKFIKNVDIEVTGRLHVNKNSDIGYQGSGQSPSTYSHFVLKTDEAFCDSIVVRVKNGGEFNIGDNNYHQISGSSNTAEMYFRAGSKLIIENGGTLRINDNSLLMIEQGADIILHPGANIVLDRSESVLEIQGKLIMKENADLDPTGNGYVRFNQDMTFGTADQLLVYEGNNEMDFSGNNRNHKRVEIASNTFITTGLDHLNIENAKVELAPGTFMSVHSPFNTLHAQYTRVGNSGLHEGLRVYGQHNLEVRDADFRYGNIGLLAVLSTYGQSMDLISCNFYDCNTGLKTQGKRIDNMRHCLFEDNNTGWLALDKEGISNMHFTTMINNNEGIIFNGQGGSGLKVSRCDFEDNANIGVSVEGTSFWSSCSRFINNNDGLIASNSGVWMNNNAQNIFDNNQDIVVNDVNPLVIDNGSNIFYAGSTYITGSLLMDAQNSLYEDPSTGEFYLPVKTNVMPGPPPIAVNLVFEDNTPIGLRDWGTPPATDYACESYTHMEEGIPKDIDGGIVVPEGGGLPLNEALIWAVQHIEGEDPGQAADNLVAMDIITAIMDHVRDVARYGDSEPNDLELDLMSEGEMRVMDLAFEYYMMALSNAYRFQELDINRAEEGQEVPEYMLRILEEAEFRLEYQVPDSQDPYMKGFEYHLSQAHIYRTGEYYDYALDKISGADEWAEDRELEIAEYWQCVFQAEEDLILENIDPEAFMDHITDCMLIAPQNKKANHPSGTSGVSAEDIVYSIHTEGLSFAIVPNPTENSSQLIIEGEHEEMDVTIYSNTGQPVYKGVITRNQENYFLKSNLAPGIYHIHLRSEMREEVLKWVIAK